MNTKPAVLTSGWHPHNGNAAQGVNSHVNLYTAHSNYDTLMRSTPAISDWAQSEQQKGGSSCDP